MRITSFYTGTMHFSRARLRGHRNGLGLSVHELAHRARLADATYREVELGRHEPDEALVEALATALGIQPAGLSGTASYETDYITAVLAHATPMSEEDVARAADILTERRTA